MTTKGSSIVDKLDSGSGGAGWQHRLKMTLRDQNRELDPTGCGMVALDAQELARQLPSCKYVAVAVMVSAIFLFSSCIAALCEYSLTCIHFSPHGTALFRISTGR